MSDDSSYHSSYSHSHEEECDDMHEAAGACDDSPHASGKRKIVSNACEFCKKRKIKCDGSFPCFQCTKRKINCEFHPRAAKRGPKSSHKRSKISEQELSELKNSNSQLKIDLEVQKRLVEYLQQQLQQTGASIPVADPARAAVASVKPRFNPDSEIFLSSRVNAMKAAITNFQHAIALFMDHYKFHGNTEFALQMWNYLLESTPEQLNNRFQGESLEQLSTLYEHCVVFMHGVRWLSYNDISEHFLSTAENLYRILFLEREAQKRSDLAQQLSHSLLFVAYYYKSIGRHEAHKLMVQDASTIISNMESYVDRYSAFVTYIGELLNSPGEPLKMEHCLKKINALMTKSPAPSDKMIFFFNTAFVFATLAGAMAGELGPTLLREVKQRLDDSESIMEKNQAVLTSNTELLKCYKIWIYGLRAVLLSHLGLEQDMQRYAQSLSTHLNQIQNMSLKLLLTRDLESKLNAINFEALAKNNRSRIPMVTLVRSVQAMIGNVKEPAAGMQAILNEEVCCGAASEDAQMTTSIANPYLIFEDFESYNNSGAFFT